MCLRLALREKTTPQWDDIALVQLSYMTYLVGERLEDAIVLVREALSADENEVNVRVEYMGRKVL